MATPRLAQPVPDEPAWPGARAPAVVFLLDAASRLERRAARALDRGAPARAADVRGRGGDSDPAVARPRGGAGASTRARGARSPPATIRCWRRCASPGCRRERDGVHARRASATCSRSAIRAIPDACASAWVLRRHPERCRIVAGEPAPLSELRERWRRAGGTDAAQTTGLADFVARQAALALERAERRLRGTRYKVPRFVREDILGAAGVPRRRRARSRASSGKPEAERRARGGARTCARSPPTHSPLRHRPRRAPDPPALHARLRRGAALRPRAARASIYALAQRHPVVFLPSHKSNLDHLVLQYALHENGHPPNHTAGGINMNFFPVGPLVRRSGVFFIRRTLQGQPGLQVRAAPLHRLPDREALLARVVHRGRPLALGQAAAAALRACSPTSSTPTGAARARTCYLIPVVDRLRPDPGRRRLRRRAARRAPSRRESFGWFLGVVRRLRRRYGDIHIRFGEPLSLADDARPARARRRARSPTSRASRCRSSPSRSSVRINRVTPITPTSLVTLALLGVGDRAAHRAPRSCARSTNLLDYVRAPRAADHRRPRPRHAPRASQRALDALVRERRRHAASPRGPTPSTRSAPTSTSTAAYYRNTIIHFFVNGAIAELALLARRRGATWPTARGRVLGRGDAAARSAQVRVLLRREGRASAASCAPSWRCTTPSGSARSAAGRTRSSALVRRFRPLQRAPRAAAVPRGLPRRRRRARAARPGDAVRRAGLPRDAAWRSASSTSCSAASTAPSRSRRCCSRPRSASPRTASCSIPVPTSPSAAALRRRDPRRAPPRRRDRRARAGRRAGLIE